VCVRGCIDSSYFSKLIIINIVTNEIHLLNKILSIKTIQSFGSQEWDAGFAVQALIATNFIEEIGPALAKGHDFIKKSQVYMLNIDGIMTILLPFNI